MNLVSKEKISSLITNETTLFWFRRDLRLDDNAGLYYALKENPEVLPVFIFDKNILDELDDKYDKRIKFIHESIAIVKNDLEERGSSLLVVHDNPAHFFSSINPKSVYTNGDYEPYAKKRDQQVAEILKGKKSSLKIFKDQVIFEKDEVLKDNHKPYTIFTPYSKKWKANLTPYQLKAYPTARYHKNLKKVPSLPCPTLEDIGFRDAEFTFPPRIAKGSIIDKYEQLRNFPAIEGTTKLSVHLRFGTVSIRKLVQLAKKRNEVWLNELIWREFYHMILWHFPDVDKAFKPAYDQIEWRNDPNEFEDWCKGRTGYPIVDAGMRELNTTGFMHNRVRMIVASFLTKHLLIDWRWGEAYFAKKLLDFDLAANNGGWQWAAGSGCDAAPYFRVFNPYLQTEKFDPDLEYIKKWVPEFESASYPKPMVDHAYARDRVLKAYKVALDQ